MTERGSGNIASHADVLLKGFEEGQGAATRDEPPRGRLVGIENQY